MHVFAKIDVFMSRLAEIFDKRKFPYRFASLRKGPAGR